MMYKLDSVPSRRISQMDSHLTILRPRDSMPSDVMSVFGAMMVMDEEDHWHYRAKFLCRILSFCLGPGNIWRFPRQAYMFGNATYVYLYILYISIFGTSLIVFEVGLGQYFAKGFAKIFSICPIMEGITLSMVFYCLVASMLYNMVTVYSFLNLFSSFYTHMPHSFCSSRIRNYSCSENSTNLRNSPEYIYFFQYIIQEGKIIDWRNAGVLIIISVLMGFMIWFAVIRNRWVPIGICSTLLLTLLCATIASLTVKGSHKGLLKMFVSEQNDIAQIKTWIYPIEQSLVSLGLGIGPLTTFWPLTNVKFWTYKQCIILNSVVFFCTMFSGMIFFNALGIVAHSKNSTIESFFKNDIEEIQTHIIVTQLFNKMTHGFSNTTTFLFYLLLFCSCLYTLLEYVQTTLLYASSFNTMREIGRTKLIGLASSLFCGLAIVATTKFGHSLIMSIDKIFIATPLLFIVSCEMITFSYLYGLRNLCDDVEFVLGFVPNYYFQITWLVLPALLFVFSICSFYLRCKIATNTYDKVMIGVMVALIIMPIITFASYKLLLAIRNKDYHNLITPAQASVYSRETERSEQ